MHVAQLVVIRFVCLMVLSVGARVASGDAPTTAPAAGKTIRLLAIGNSFSENALFYLRPMAKAGGHTLIADIATISGASLERHVAAINALQATPNDAAARPYKRVAPDGTVEWRSLRDILTADKWEIVTVQQASPLSYKPETYQPFANELADYIHQHAPAAKLVVHETWAYRVDHPLFASGVLTQTLMYARLHHAYQGLAGDIGAETELLVGTAFQNVREDPRWQTVINPDVDMADFQYPDLPKPDHALCEGYVWAIRKDPPALYADRFHASPSGKFLAAAVWYETLFGDVRDSRYCPPTVAEQDAKLLREIAHKTVRKGLLPAAVHADQVTR